MTTYYVAKTGSNGNTGGSGDPWLTITYAISQVVNTDVIEIQDSGTYQERVNITKEITLQAAAGQSPVIDGIWRGQFPVPATGVLPGGDHYDGSQTGVYTALLQVSADNVTVDGLTVQWSTGRGIAATGVDNCTISNCASLNSYSTGLLGHTITNSLFENCEVASNCTIRLDPQNPTGGNWPISSGTLYSSYVTISGCVVHDNHGEGIVTAHDDDHVTIEDCTSYNNRAPNIYVRGEYPIIQRNFVFCTDDYVYGPSPGIVMANEEYAWNPPLSTDQIVINNIVVNCRHGIAFWYIEAGGGLDNARIEHNTVVNSKTNTLTNKQGIGLYLTGALHANSYVRNNIFYQTESSNGEVIASVADNSGVTFSNNCWFGQTTDPDASGSGDITNNPLMVDPVSLSSDADADASNYALQATSLCIDAGSTGTAVTDDYNGDSRDASPDMGAFEDGGTPPPSGSFDIGTPPSPCYTTTPVTGATCSFSLGADTNKILVFVRRLWWYTNSATITGITYNGTALTLVGQTSIETNGSYQHQVSVYELDDPDTGSSYDLVITGFQITSYFISVVPFEFAGATAGATPFTGTSAAISGTVTPDGTGSIVVGGFMHRGHDADPFTPGSGVTELIDGDTGGTSNVSDFGAWEGYKSGTTAGVDVTIDATPQDSDLWLGVIVEVAAGSVSGYTASAAFSGTPTSGSANLEVSFTDSSTTTDPSGIDSWSWELNDGSGWVEFSTEQNPLYLFPEGTYSIRLTVTSVNGATDTEEKTDYIAVSGSAGSYTVVADFSATPRSGFVPLTVAFSDLSTVDSPDVIDTWSWKADDGGGYVEFSTEQNPVYQFTAAGTYAIQLVATSASTATDTESKTAYIVVNAAPGSPSGGGQYATALSFRRRNLMPAVLVQDPVWFTYRRVIDDSLVFRLSDLNFDIQANGGYWQAGVSINANVAEAEDWIVNGLGRDVTIYDESLSIVWKGFVDSVNATVGPLQISRGPMLDVVNRLAIAYRTITYNTNPPVGGKAKETAQGNNTLSQARYGILTGTLSGGEGDEDSMDQARDMYLNGNAWPITSITSSIGQGGEPSVSLSLKGYVHFLDKYPYVNLDATVVTPYVNLSSKIGDILDADPNALFTDRSRISENTWQVPDYEDGSKSGWALIKGMVMLGDAGENRHTFGVYGKQQPVYGPVPTEVAYQQRMGDPGNWVRDVGGGYVSPWGVRPCRWLRIGDFLGASAAAPLEEDPRHVFIESVSYQAPWGLSINGGKVSRLDQRLAKLGIKGAA